MRCAARWLLGPVGGLALAACGSAPEGATPDAPSTPTVDAGVDATPPGPDDPPGTWRSALFPYDWTPATTHADGWFLHDVSYAGYHRSEAPLPTTWPGVSVDVTAHGAIADDAGDDAPAFAAAIAAVVAAGGGEVYIPDGEYVLASPVVVAASGVRLRGQSRAGTRLYSSAPVTGGQAALAFVGAAPAATPAHPLLVDGVPRSHRVRVASADDLAVGDDLLVEWTITQAFVDEHGMDGLWDSGPASALDQRRVFFRRELIAIEPVADGVELVLDVPLRYPTRIRDGAQVRRDVGALREVGLESLSVANAVEVTDAMAQPRVHAVRLARVVDGYVRDVGSYDSARAPGTDHLRSGGIEVVASKRVTVADVALAHAQHHGDGGAGYGFEASTSSEVLFRDVRAEDFRHSFIQNYDFGASGLVWLRAEAVDGTSVNGGFTTPGRSEFHHRLAMASLFDSVRDTAGFAAYNRGEDSSNSGHAATECVFWNVAGEDAGTRMSIYQAGRGYVIGTHDVTPMVEPDLLDDALGYDDDTGPTDWLEGKDAGETLWPRSLFEAQLARRLAAGE